MGCKRRDVRLRADGAFFTRLQRDHNVSRDSQTARQVVRGCQQRAGSLCAF